MCCCNYFLALVYHLGHLLAHTLHFDRSLPLNATLLWDFIDHTTSVASTGICATLFSLRPPKTPFDYLALRLLLLRRAIIEVISSSGSRGRGMYFIRFLK